jgi:hypothetical protein
MTEAARPVPTWADFVYEAFYSGAIGGSVVALFFLVVDSIQGEPFFTPSLMGQVLFEGSPAGEIVDLRLDMVALYSAVHFATFGLLGCAVALAVREVELHARNPVGVLLGLFVIVEWAFFVTAWVFLPGVMAVLGPFRVALANLLAASGIVLFLTVQHRPEAWGSFKKAVGSS